MTSPTLFIRTFCASLLLVSYTTFAQPFLPLENTVLLRAEKAADSLFRFHSSIKPYFVSSSSTPVFDSIANITAGWKLTPKDSKTRISLLGITAANGGMEVLKGLSLRKYELEGGLQLQTLHKGARDRNFGTSFTFFSGQSSFPSPADSISAFYSVVPGIGPAYELSDSYTYQHYAGYLSYSPNKIFNFQAGRDKSFFGDGHRSLFLSDVAAPYPFLKISTTAGRFKYVSLFASLKDATAPSHQKKDFLNKYGTFHYLSWNVSRRVNLALFEAIIWQGTDANRERSFDVNYLNPVIFFRPVEYSLGSSDNSFLGGAFKIKTGKRYKQLFYGQLILDEFLLKEVMAIFKKLLDRSVPYGWWANKQGVQLGFKSFDLFRLKGLDLLTEINAVRPYTYAHGSVQQNYAHYNQPLAHPLGANFAESVSRLQFSRKRFRAEAEFMYAIVGRDKDGKNYGQNIFLSYTTRPNDYGNKFFQGLKTKVMYQKVSVGYFVLPSASLLAEAGFASRQESNAVISSSANYFFIGLRTPIMNRYNDF